MKPQTYNVIGTTVCQTRTGWRSSGQLSSVIAIRATTKTGAIRKAKRTWRERGELPVPGMYRRARCTIHAHGEEV